jgi:hypothetical protein
MCAFPPGGWNRLNSFIALDPGTSTLNIDVEPRLNLRTTAVIPPVSLVTDSRKFINGDRQL